MNNFINLLTTEIVSVIEGLTGQTPEIKFENERNIDNALMVKNSMAQATLKCENGSLSFAMDVELATALGDMMLGGEGEEQTTMSDDDLDASKEIISNIFGAVATALTAQNDLPNLNFDIENIQFLETGSNFDTFTKLYTMQVQIGTTEAKIYFAGNLDFISNFEIISNDIDIEDESNNQENVTLSQEELKNMDLLMDVQLPIRVRIGTKTLLLKDVLNMDIGSVIELDQLANEPLDVLVGDKIIAKGEVVIVDGNFGVQIVEIGTPKEILSQLR
jgi:flagellar motor switch protein FliN/FliY